MKSFEYGDSEIGAKEMSVAVASMILGVGIFTLPRTLIGKTSGVDAWISILLAGTIICCATYVSAKLASRFPGQSFMEYTSRIVSKPVAAILTFGFGVYAIMHTAFEIRSMGNIAEMYLFERTPTAALVLIALLVVAYAVTGSRVAIFRLNLMFLPIVFVIAFSIIMMNVNVFDIDRLRPFFPSDWRELLMGTKEAAYKMIGFEIVLFYTMYLNRPKEAPKASLYGLIPIILLYVLIFIFCIGVFGTSVTQQIVYPTVELARQVEVPGEFFERFESIFFTVWIMTIFNTSFMALDVAMLAFYSLFKKGKKIHYICVLCPIVYLVAMFSPDIASFIQYTTVVSIFGLIVGIAMPIVLLLIAKMRGVKANG